MTQTCLEELPLEDLKWELEKGLEEYGPSSYTRANASAFETWTSARSQIRYRS